MSIAQQLKRVQDDPMFEQGMSEYEKARIANIRANEAALRALGLDCNNVTVVASDNKAPLKKKMNVPQFFLSRSSELRHWYSNFLYIWCL